MRGIFWNIRGLNNLGRNLCLGNLIRSNRIDFIGIQETKKDSFHPSFLKNLTTPAVFKWDFLPANGTVGRILLRVREDTMDLLMLGYILLLFLVFWMRKVRTSVGSSWLCMYLHMRIEK
jgi:hypothetical protein